MNYIINGDSLQELKKLPDNIIDSVVTDPPYELGFMGKSWDNTGIANNVKLWEEVLRVLKPGGHMLAFSGTRTYHRMVSAIEDAGFEIRDMINYTYGSGFPKNHDISKAIEKKKGVKPIGKKPAYGAIANRELIDERGWNNINNALIMPETQTEETKQWQGFGTALKPSHEPIVLARKPVEGTIADNVLTYGTGAINIDGSRVDTNGEKLDVGGRGKHNRGEGYGFQPMGDYEIPEGQGRYPANTILAADEEVTALFPNDTSRYFQQIEYNPIIYQAKASKKERNKGLDDFEPQAVNDGREKDIDNPYQRGTTPRKNTHPTVKPIKLMEYLVKLITPPGGVVLDMFAGSGTTLIAAKTQGFNYIGIELTPEYVEIAEARLKSY
jgi:DNA modification methylase